MAGKQPRILLIAAILLCAFQCAALGGITGFSPKYGQVGDTVNISGSGFVSGMTVTFYNNKSVILNTISSTTQTPVTVPAGATNGPISVTINGVKTYSTENFTVIGPGPYVVNFTPNHGSPVTINGTHFTYGPTTTVSFNGKAGSLVNAPGNAIITANPPADVETGPITVTSGGLSWTTTNVYYANPVLTNFSPAAAKIGQNVVISGKNLLGTTVTLNGMNCPYTNSTTPNTKITFAVPPGATSGLINIANLAGQVFSATSFGVLPTFDSFSPTHGDVGTLVTISGAGFDGVKSVQFNNAQPVTPASKNSTQITVNVPAGASSGPITLVTDYGNVASSATFYLPPVITYVAQSFGMPGTKVFITGKNFAAVSNVNFNGKDAAFDTPYTLTTLTSTVPVRATVGPIYLTTPGGTASSSNVFYPPPVIDSFTPDAGVPRVSVTITGLNLMYFAGSVMFNGAASTNVTINTNNANQISATVPTNATTGPIVVKGMLSATSSVPFRVDALQLAIQKVPTNLISVSWPTSAVGYNLRYTSKFEKTNVWADNTNSAKVQGIFQSITLSNSTTPRFYQLQTP